MNLRILITPILFIYCSVFITSISLNYNFAASANTIAQKPDVRLSTAEKADLEQGQVILKGEQGNYLGQVVATGNIETAWEVITDYDNFARFLPNIKLSKVIDQQGDRIVFEQVNVVDLWLFKQEFAIQIEAIKSKPNKVDFQIVDGDLKKLIGRWGIEAVSPGKILVSHAVEVEPGSDTEKPFFYGVYESSLEETLQAIAQEITKRSKI